MINILHYRLSFQDNVCIYHLVPLTPSCYYLRPCVINDNGIQMPNNSTCQLERSRQGDNRAIQEGNEWSRKVIIVVGDDWNASRIAFVLLKETEVRKWWTGEVKDEWVLKVIRGRGVMCSEIWWLIWGPVNGHVSKKQGSNSWVMQWLNENHWNKHRTLNTHNSVYIQELICWLAVRAFTDFR